MYRYASLVVVLSSAFLVQNIKLTSPSCGGWTGVDFNNTRMLKGLREKGYYYPMMKDITMKPSEFFKEIPRDTRTWRTKQCATMTSISPFGSMDLETIVSYNSTRMMTGTLVSKNGMPMFAGVTKVSMYADTNIVLTNEKDYFVLVFCIFGHEPFWAVLSPNETLSTNHREKILDHLAGLGFRRDGIENPKSPKLKPYKLKMHACKEKKPKDQGVSNFGFDMSSFA